VAGVTHTHFPFQIHTSGGVAKSVKRTFARVHRSPQGEMASTSQRPSSVCFLNSNINLLPPRDPLLLALPSVRRPLLDPSSWTRSLSRVRFLTPSVSLFLALCLLSSLFLPTPQSFFPYLSGAGHHHHKHHCQNSSNRSKTLRNQTHCKYETTYGLPSLPPLLPPPPYSMSRAEEGRSSNTSLWPKMAGSPTW
jgi:hypothetical protein